MVLNIICAMRSFPVSSPLVYPSSEALHKTQVVDLKDEKYKLFCMYKLFAHKIQNLCLKSIERQVRFVIHYYQGTKSKICVQKVGEQMAKKDIAKQVVVTSGGIARTADFLVVGLSKSDVCTLNNEGYLERVRHGYYKLANDDDVSEEQLLATLIPEGIVCMESALFHYGYSDFSPRVWTLAVPRTVSRPKLKIDAIHFKPYFIPKGYYEIGKTTAKFNGITLAVYDRERTICDCFKHRTKLDNETFNKAIHAYVADDQKNLSNLSKYAKDLGLFKRVTELMEVLLNG